MDFKGNFEVLKGENYLSWKRQCRLILIRDGLWNIVNGGETAPASRSSDELKAAYKTRREKAAATIGLAILPSLMYVIKVQCGNYLKATLSQTLRSINTASKLKFMI